MKKIFHADDVQRFRDDVRSALSDDYDVVSFTDSDQVMEALKEEQPDLVVLDHLMPSDTDNTGFDVCQHIRAEYPSLPVVIYTGAWEDHQNREQVQAKWGTTVVYKSEGRSALRSAIHKLLPLNK